MFGFQRLSDVYGIKLSQSSSLFFFFSSCINQRVSADRPILLLSLGGAWYKREISLSKKGVFFREGFLCCGKNVQNF